jgi:aminotransferase in exopolysaccharide biosynthesis
MLKTEKFTLPQQIVLATRKAAGNGSLALHEPSFGGNEWKYVKECLDSTFVSSVGKFVDRFENDLASYTGATFAVAVVNGTAALQVALRVAGVLAGEEVLVPALTFVATANAVVHCGAVPHFIDSEEHSFGVDHRKLRDYLRNETKMRGGQCINMRSGRVIRALVPVHTFGHPADILGLMEVAKEFGLLLIEDAAESLGSTVGGRHTGTFGTFGILSFNGNKTITTGGGGAILTNDPQLALKAKHLTTTAKLPHRWEYVHDELGYNYRMPNINAALGCAQLEQLSNLLAQKRRLYERYLDAFKDVSNVRMLGEVAGRCSNFWLQALVLNPKVAHQRDAILAGTNDAGVMTRPIWKLLHQLAPYESYPRMPMPVAEALVQRVINLPSSASLGKL